MDVNQNAMARDLFFYSSEFLPLAASGTAEDRIPFQSDSEFLITALTGDVRSAETSETLIDTPAINVLITISGTGRQLMDRAQRWNNIIGTAQRPNILAVPKTVPANSTVTIQLSNLVANDRYCRISLHGYKLFPIG